MEKDIKKKKKIDRIIERGTLGFIFFLPFLPPLAYLGLIIALIYWLQKVKLRGILDIKPRIFSFALIGLTSAVLLSVVFSVDKLFSLECFGLYLFYPLTCLLMIQNIGNNNIKIEKILKVIVLSGIIVTGFGILQFLIGYNFEFHWYFLNINMSSDGELTSTWGNPNRFAKYLDIALPLSFIYLLTQENIKKKILPAIFIGMGFICLPLTKCLGGIAAIFAALLILFAVKNWKLCLVFLISLSIFTIFKFDWLINFVNAYSFMEPRLYTWKNIIPSIIKDYPITGSGLGTYVKISPYYSLEPLAIHSHAHNIYFNYLSELGILGFGMLLFAIIIFFRSCIIFFRKYSFFAARGVVAGCFLSIFSAMIHGIVETFVDYFPLGLLFWLVIGLGIGTIGTSKTSVIEEKLTEGSSIEKH